MPSSGQLAIDIMCGSWGASRCNAERWFKFMGDASSPFVPFQIDYIASEHPIDKFVPMDPSITPCNKPVNVCMHTLDRFRSFDVPEGRENPWIVIFTEPVDGL